MYCRISRDQADTQLGVRRQESDCRALADGNGWEIADIYVDNDVSAYSRKRRDGYMAMMDDVKLGEIDSIVAWHPDRLHRSPRELEDFIDVIESRGVRVQTVQAGEYDLSTAAGRMTARVVGAVARHESEHKSERIRRKHLELAASGKPSGGKRGFGYNADLTIRDDEAALIRQAVGDVISGSSTRSIARCWNENGISTVNDKPWVPNVVARMLRSARIAGFREHKGKLTVATWPAIIDEVQFAQVRAVLDDPGRRKNWSRRTYMLTGGLAICGICGANLVARPRADKSRCYVCASDQGGCGKIRILADAFEDWVTEMVMARANRPFADAIADMDTQTAAGAIERAIAEREDRLVELAALWADGSISRSEWDAARSRLENAVDDAQTRLAELRPATTEMAGLADRWPDMEIERRRAVLAEIIDAVRVGPAVRGRNRFDPNRIDVRWRV